MVSAVINVAPEGNLTRYLQEIRKFPMLTPEEELDLSKRWRDHEDTEAAHKLVTSHLRLVAKIAMGYRGYGLPIGEAHFSEGNVGHNAGGSSRFEPEQGLQASRPMRCGGSAPRSRNIFYAFLVAGEDGHHRKRRRSCSSICGG